MKRADYLDWEEEFMFSARLAAERSKDPHTQVGAVIVNAKKRIVATGYNGLPRGCSDDEFPWARERDVEDVLDSKTFYVVHAELNAILNAEKSVEDCTIFTTLFPCAPCTGAILQSGIKRVVYLRHKGKWDEKTYVASRRMMDAAGVPYVRHDPRKKSITLPMENDDDDNVA
jgi:dCMP deaminase